MRKEVPRQSPAGAPILGLGLFRLFNELADLAEGLITQIVFDLAGVLRGHFGETPSSVKSRVRLLWRL